MLKKRPSLKRTPLETVPGVFPAGARIMLIGQAPADVELLEGYPFAGPSGAELNVWLARAGIRRQAVAITNVFSRPLPETGLAGITDGKQTELKLHPIARGRYLRPEWNELPRLDEEVRSVAPHLIIALGAEALWATHGTYEIGRNRGAFYVSRQGPKAISTYHPSYVLRAQRRPRNICIADMIKAARAAETPALSWPERWLWMAPTLAELWEFKEKYLDGAERIFVDIETDPYKLRQITSVGFAPSPFVGVCVPFSFKLKSYWPTAEEEADAIRFVRAVCELPAHKALQNGLYDAQWLWTEWKVRVRHYDHDTRLLHHAILPEMPKDLGFIGSLWADEAAWKLYGHSEKSDD